MGILTLLLLGPPEVRHAGLPVRFATRKALALLVYLALEGGIHSREKLMALFWPESDTERARMALRRTLAYLHEAIADDGPGASRAHLHVSRGGLGFEPAGAESDVRALEAVWLQLREPSTAEITAPVLLPQFQQAAARYRGDFLDGFSLSDAPAFDEWAAVQREQWHRRTGLIYERLAELQFATGDHDGAIETAARWIAHSPLNEAAHRQLMRIHLAAGDRAAALRAYEACRALLYTELGAPPAPETESLATRARSEVLPQAGVTGGSAIAALPPPALRSAARPPGLPAPPNALIGREHEVAAVVATLRAGVRLLTLLGPPGIGKTRLAIQAAEEAAPLFGGAVCFVALATVSEPDLVAPAILAALGLDDEQRSPVAQLKQALRDRRLLLLLDNFEQLQDAAGLVSELLAAAPLLAVLVTSRSPLQIYGEHERIVGPLALPDLTQLPAPAALATIAAPRLFLERARAVRPDLNLSPEQAAAIAAICVRLDGLPLAIELAAARVRTLTPQRVLERLRDPLAVLVGGPRDRSARQQTLRGAIAWSDRLLNEDERLAFAQAGVFVGGWTLEAAEVVCTPLSGPPVAETLARLVEVSLLTQAHDAEGKARFGMLQAIREYTCEQQAARGIRHELSRRHAQYFLGLAETIEPQLSGPAQSTLLAQLECEHDNLRAALGWMLAEGEVALALRLCASLWWFWFVRGHLGEGRRWIAATLELDATRGQPEACATSRLAVLIGGGVLAHDQGDYAPAARLLEASLLLGRQLGHEKGVGAALNNLGLVAGSRGDYPAAAAYYQESLACAQRRGDDWATAVARSNLGMVAAWQGRYAEAIAHYSESLTLRRALGDTRGIAVLLNRLADSLLHAQDVERAVAFYGESLSLHEALNDRAGRGDTLYGLAQVALARRAWPEAQEHLCACLELREALGDRRGVAECLEGGAMLAMSAGALSGAAMLLGAAQGLRAAIGVQLLPLEHAAHERLLDDVRAAMGDERFARAWTEGQALAHGEAPGRARALASLLDESGIDAR